MGHEQPVGEEVMDIEKLVIKSCVTPDNGSDQETQACLIGLGFTWSSKE